MPASGQAGFTLVELLVVLLILGMLAAFAAPPVMRHLGKAKSDVAKVQVQNLSAALDLYRLDVGRYPTQEEGLPALVRRPAAAEGWNGPYVKKEALLVDPWGTAYVFKIPGGHGEYDLLTLGSDRAEGGTGEAQDVTSW
jgi:general secretion pathway protein G